MTPPELLLPHEADHCQHCGRPLTWPPSCCDSMRQEYLALQSEISDPEVIPPSELASLFDLDSSPSTLPD